MLLQVLLALALLAVFYQDRKYRAVYWWMYPLLVVLLLFLKKETISWPVILQDGLCNLVFLILQLLVLSMYFSLKKKRWVNITAGYLGWGDILFLIAATVYFSPLNYFAFYLLSLIVVILLVLLSGKYKLDNYKIPLAGWQSVFFLLLLLLEWNRVIPNLRDDDWLMEKLVF